MFTAILATYVAAEVVTEIAIAVVLYRNRKVLIPKLRRFIFDAAGTAKVLSEITDVKTMVEVLIPTPQEDTNEFGNHEEATRATRFAMAVEEARRKHTKKPVFENFK